MGLRENVAARKAATEILELAAIDDHADHPLFWQIIADNVERRLPPRKVAPKDQPMTIQEVRCFGSSLMPFGEYQGQPVNCVPFERLAFYVDSEWTRKAGRFLKAKPVQEAWKRESEPDA